MWSLINALSGLSTIDTDANRKLIYFVARQFQRSMYKKLKGKDCNKSNPFYGGDAYLQNNQKAVPAREM